MASQDQNLQLVMLPFRSMERAHSRYYRRAASCWQLVWQDLLRKHHLSDKIFLDQLLRHDEGACIFTQDRCVGMILFRTLDFSIMDFRADSYFKEWDSSDVANLIKHGSKAFLSTFMTVHPDFRNYSPEFKFKEVLLDLMIKRFLMSDADVISGITRRDRGIHDESYKLGARVIREDIDYMGGAFKVDLVAFYRAQAKESESPGVRKISDHLWAHRIDYLEKDRALKVA
jgi:hypothetical protein